jgi:hypothetical protein
MNISEKLTWSALIYIVSICIVGPLTFLSWLIAFSYDEGTIVNSIGKAGHYAFHVFRFPTHNLVAWLNIEGDYFFIGLVINVFINSAILTWIVITIMTRMGKFKAFH